MTLVHLLIATICGVDSYIYPLNLFFRVGPAVMPDYTQGSAHGRGQQHWFPLKLVAVILAAGGVVVVTLKGL